ncbi:glutamine amidotransferase [Rhodobacteraceae bacterium HSP-20]|uniref:Glutamine amidotransferase n=1 Tax=Paragemmobacter amnigenus TaxID=2852097 RepID=A0ABS6J015_9RHOB|nr:glutamine amidotransferase [Rhodobacter amnigenus]MBU9697078.1 glutamine amidotransferase [Rhodobacter amnigenus]MBV4388305.1 glutamine amidotransferase [Rhodobacter amnigenus]
MTASVILAPLVPVVVLWVLAGLAVAFVALALWRGLAGWWLRGLTACALLAALANPSLQEEERAPLSDIVLLVVDESSSQRLGDRAAQTAEAVAAIEAKVAGMENTELRVVRFGDGPEDAGSLAMTALAEALSEEPRARVAGAILISDGQVHDMGLVPALPAPLHLLMTGREADWDRRLVVKNAPAFAILGEEVTLTLRIEDQGAAPGAEEADLTITVDGGAPQTYRVPVGQDLDLPVVLPHGGMNVLQFATPAVEGELTERNNAAVVQMNGVRDRLRVLLVSGEPHAGERVWRNLLKSDASVDLVHFTILRPPEKQDGIPVTELSLIAFPTRELFVEKIEEFDLIIFDRYRMRGILPMSYLENVANYVSNGGTVLVAAGPEFGAVDSLWRSPLAEVLPVEPTARVIERAFVPELTDLGRRHPVTEGLEALAPEGGWGRWFRQVEVSPRAGQVVMQGADGRPLLVLDRVGEGRVAVLASDHAWLWGRGFEGGGPQLELLRRLAHWMLKEPELEEEALTATARGQALTITRRTVAEGPPGDVTVTGPDGAEVVLPMPEAGPGKFETVWQAPVVGLYRLEQGDLVRVVAVGPSAPREFEATIATGEVMAEAVAATNGGVLRVEEGAPDIRLVREGRPAAGRGWIGITPRGAYVTEDVSVAPVLPAWAWLLLAAALAVAAWLLEGRRGGRRVSGTA